MTRLETGRLVLEKACLTARHYPRNSHVHHSVPRRAP